ncbi:hypothetical protein H0H92_004630 [Tricholoma furcatifolium]|nr:hypothetical protein H0H92_004630 [Tricholoma furcatifolium]
MSKAYETITNEVLFDPEQHHIPETGVSWEHALLYEMVLLRGGFFQAPSLLQRSPRTAEFFDSDYTLRDFKEFPIKPLEERITEQRPKLSREELAGAVDFISQCLRLEPSTRPTAEDLLNHPWLKTET